MTFRWVLDAIFSTIWSRLWFHGVSVFFLLQMNWGLVSPCSWHFFSCQMRFSLYYVLAFISTWSVRFVVCFFSSSVRYETDLRLNSDLHFLISFPSSHASYPSTIPSSFLRRLGYLAISERVQTRAKIQWRALNPFPRTHFHVETRISLLDGYPHDCRSGNSLSRNLEERRNTSTWEAEKKRMMG